jgi:hypothetical protein
MATAPDPHFKTPLEAPLILSETGHARLRWIETIMNIILYGKMSRGEVKRIFAVAAQDEGHFTSFAV